MSGDMMLFPDTVEEFMETYKIVDVDQVYTNGMEMVPIFRMRQWFEHEKMNQWIPVTERLPEVDKRVVVSVSGKNDPDYQMVTVGSWSGVTNHGEPHFYEFGDSVTVTAWMPLPEPYQEARQ